VLRLPAVRELSFVLLVHKFGYSASDAIITNRILERGINKRDLGLAAIIDLPFQILIGIVMARRIEGGRNMRYLVGAVYVRFVLTAAGMLMIYWWPVDLHVDNWLLALVLAFSLVSSCVSNVHFVSVGAMFARIGDPAIGGTYLTMLNTMTNFGGTWPRYFIMKAVDSMSTAVCLVDAGEAGVCSTTAQREACVAAGGTCKVTQDGFFVVQGTVLVAGAVVFALYCAKRFLALANLDLSHWRVPVARD
jgi:MFS transporter, PAT family, solute carrier family 33 (acetyl-CoA transportor), member 1